MLKKKQTIQKTFRIDRNVNEDFETLCEILERTQNDLANVAIENLLEDNKYWLAKNILVDYACDYLCNGRDVDFEVEGISVQIKELEDGNTYLRIIHKDRENNIIQEYEQQYNEQEDNDYDEEIEKQLRFFASFIDYNSLTIQEYLKGKLDYK